MKHILHKKGWIYRAVQIHVDPSTIPIIKIKFDAMVDQDFHVRIIFIRNLTSERHGMYEFGVALFDNGYLEEFIIFQ